MNRYRSWGLLLAGFACSVCWQASLSAQQSSFIKMPTRKFRTPDEMLLFVPSRFPEGDWQTDQITFQDVFFQAADGTKLHGWYCPCDQPRATILLSHGNAGNVAFRTRWLRILQTRLKVSVLIYDYRGYGRSEGKPTIPGAIQDGQAARKKLAELSGRPLNEIVLMGESLGGAISVQLAAESPPKALVLQSTFTSFHDVAKVHASKLAWMVPKSRLNSIEALKQVQAPLLISHGTVDTVIPLTHGQALYRAAEEPKEFVSIEAVGHNDWIRDEYIESLSRFLDGLDK
ncbi:Putative aminoacrylate hydrolase RutD [Stieleria bergensis]|uniref:Aminoacrylate hydrolase RutD n=1 Tax=Stieleria bergensis TaxID=2528025 RepID=A0A517SSG6_9BACT|nr:Putative aminoacrylate hydrolase RutD [Planctomycetes bacterium SV_7m_r]